MEPQDSLPCYKGPLLAYVLSSMKSVASFPFQYYPPIYGEVSQMISSLFSDEDVLCVSHLILFDFIVSDLCGEEITYIIYYLKSSNTSSFLGPNILLRMFFLHRFIVSSSLNARIKEK
jgi:hypothetical protein